MAASAAKRQYVNDWRPVEKRSPITRVLEGDFIVQAYSILSTDHVEFAVFEAEDGHSSTRSLPHYGRLGAVQSRPLPADIAAIPLGTPERLAACQARRDGIDEVCANAIRAAYPELVTGGHLRILDGHGSCHLADYHALVQL